MQDTTITHLPPVADLMVAVDDPYRIRPHEHAAIVDNYERFGLSFYRFPVSELSGISGGAHSQHDEEHTQRTQLTMVKHFWQQFGLKNALPNPQSDDDGISRITATGDSRYIPYTTRALNWHTDGYYNKTPIRSFTMHCVRPATRGGENTYFDHRVLYRLLEEINPAYIAALSRDDTMTLPANEYRGKVLRDARCVPVFSYGDDGDLLMRWTEREHNIVWRSDKACDEARRAVRDILRKQTHLRIRHTLKRGEGVICSNILHCRTAFEDTPHAPRLLLRGRYNTKITATGA